MTDILEEAGIKSVSAIARRKNIHRDYVFVKRMNTRIPGCRFVCHGSINLVGFIFNVKLKIKPTKFPQFSGNTWTSFWSLGFSDSRFSCFSPSQKKTQKRKLHGDDFDDDMDVEPQMKYKGERARLCCQAELPAFSKTWTT